MVYPTPEPSRKRSCSTAQNLTRKSGLRNASLKMVTENPPEPLFSTTSTADYTVSQANKRQCLSSSGSSIVTSDKNRRQYPPTPPISPPQVDHQTIDLKITIPQREPSQQDQRRLKTRVAAAERWKSKLTRPLPLRREITDAYPLKLMRHYPGHAPSTEANFIKPKIDRSPRVEKLLREFPTLQLAVTKQGARTTVQSLLLTPAEQKDWDALKTNVMITTSELVQKSAWENFASLEKGREDRGRESMLQSGLWTDDLIREMNGQQNGLPEWKKLNTGKFVKGKNK